MAFIIPIGYAFAIAAVSIAAICQSSDKKKLEDASDNDEIENGRRKVMRQNFKGKKKTYKALYRSQLKALQYGQ